MTPRQKSRSFCSSKFLLLDHDCSTKSAIIRHKNSLDVKVISAVGEVLPAVIRGETNLLDTLINDNLLSQFYSKTLGIDFYQQEMARIARQISNRFPHVNVLEIGEFHDSKQFA